MFGNLILKMLQPHFPVREFPAARELQVYADKEAFCGFGWIDHAIVVVEYDCNDARETELLEEYLKSEMTLKEFCRLQKFSPADCTFCIKQKFTYKQPLLFCPEIWHDMKLAELNAILENRKAFNEKTVR